MLGKINPYLPVSWRWGPRRSASPEPNDRRMLPRIPKVLATVIIDESIFPLNDWSPKGFMVTAYEGRYDVGASFSVTLILPASGNTFRFEAKAKVVRLDKRLKQLAAIFTGLDAKTINRLMQIAASKRYDSKGRAM